MSWLYILKDTGYLDVKVGKDGSANGLGRIKEAPGSTPRDIIEVAAWQLGECDRFTHNSLETAVHRNLNRLRHPDDGHPWQAGREWFSDGAERVVNVVCELLGRAPDRSSDKPMDAKGYDDYREKGPLSLRRYKHVAVLYEERYTGRLKLQATDHWKIVNERKTYSRNGFRPVAAFTYPQALDADANLKLHATVRLVQSTYWGLSKSDDPDRFYGWLPEGVPINAVMDSLGQDGFQRFGVHSDEAPIGVRLDRRANSATGKACAY
ncbi:MAG: hypothetical protein RLW87_20275 [Alphaproteobacteria bacterium]